MKRMLAATVGVAALALGAVPAARADFHPACTAGTNPAANVALTAGGGSLTFAGSVMCPGATVTIHSVTFTPQVPGSTSVTAGPGSCSPCGMDPFVVSGTAPATPGVYDVRMTFSASGNNLSYSNVGRKIRYAYSGSGQPTVVCNNQGLVRCPN